MKILFIQLSSSRDTVSRKGSSGITAGFGKHLARAVAKESNDPASGSDPIQP